MFLHHIKKIEHVTILDRLNFEIHYFMRLNRLSN